jgi:hypothetical protein
VFHKVRDIDRAHGVSGLARRSIAYAYRRVSNLWRTGNPLEHWTSFEREPPAAAVRERPVSRRSAYVRFGSLADIAACPSDVRFTPESRHSAARLKCPLSAIRQVRGRYLMLAG